MGEWHELHETLRRLAELRAEKRLLRVVDRLGEAIKEQARTKTDTSR